MGKENTLMRWLKRAFRLKGVAGAASAACEIRAEAGAVGAACDVDAKAGAVGTTCSPVPHVIHAVYGGGCTSAPRVAHAVYSAPVVMMRVGCDSMGAGAGLNVDGSDSGACMSDGGDAGAGGGVCESGAHDAAAVGDDCSTRGGACDAGTSVGNRMSIDAADIASFSQPANANPSYTATFRRIEKKYCLDQLQYQELLAVIRQHMQPDDYPQTVVSSVYYDTSANELISKSLEKPLYKEKLRVRSYGSLQPDGSVIPVSDQVFLELKKKYKGVVYKRRLALSAGEARSFLQEVQLANYAGAAHGGVDGMGCAGVSRDGMDDMGCSGANHISKANQKDEECGDMRREAWVGSNSGQARLSSPLFQNLTFQKRQVACEIAAFLERYDSLRPAMVTQCVRTAWKQPGSQLRITFDEQLRAGRPESDALTFRIAGTPLSLLQPGQVLMEIKQAGGMPLWLVEALSANQMYPQSFSKYGTAYEMTHALLRTPRAAGASYAASQASRNNSACGATFSPSSQAYVTTYKKEALHA